MWIKQFPEMWVNLLLSLTPSACAHLLTYWDTLTDDVLSVAASSGSSSSSHTGVLHTSNNDNIKNTANVSSNRKKNNSAICDNSDNTDSVSDNSSENNIAVVVSLESFFHNIFAPCGERVPQVSKNKVF